MTKATTWDPVKKILRMKSILKSRTSVEKSLT